MASRKVPSSLRKRVRMVIRPVIVVPVERYTPEHKAEFLLSTATTRKDYQRARREVTKLGLAPDAIPHRLPCD
jgi:hypothetical protein